MKNHIINISKKRVIILSSLIILFVSGIFYYHNTGIHSENDECTPPCFFGVFPGKTTEKEFLDNFKDNGEMIKFERKDGSILYTVQPIEIENINTGNQISATFVVADSNVKTIFALGRYVFGDRNDEINKGISSMGQPTDVYIDLRIDVEPYDSFYHLLIVFKDFGTIIRISSSAEIHDNEIVYVLNDQVEEHRLIPHS